MSDHELALLDSLARYQSRLLDDDGMLDMDTPAIEIAYLLGRVNELRRELGMGDLDIAGRIR